MQPFVIPAMYADNKKRNTKHMHFKIKLAKFIILCKKYTQPQYANWWLISTFAFTIFLQCWIFHYLTFDILLKPFSVFSLAKIAISIFIASFVFFFKSKWWTIITSILINCWILTELVYSRANSVFMDAYAWTMVGNMQGFWNSVFVFLYPKDLLLIIPTILLIIFCILFNNKQRNWKYGVYCLLASIVLSCISVDTVFRTNHSGRIGEKQVKEMYTINPFSYKIKFAVGSQLVQDGTITKYIEAMSVMHHLVLNVFDFIRLEDSNYDMPKEDEERLLKDFINHTNNDTINPQTPLIICLIESFETWTISPEMTPNLYQEVTTNQNLLYCPYILSQRRGGNSSDGQLIINTGLLPLEKGAAVFRFPLNKYPALSSIYDKSAGIFPHELGVWNQRYMNQSYEIDNAYVTKTSDKIIFPKVIEASKSHDYVLALTMSTHSPFTEYADSSKLYLPNTFPSRARDYAKSVNYMDEGLGILLRAWHSDEKLHSSTIVITADHNIFKQREELFSGKYEHLNQTVGHCPLIIISPNINGNIHLSDTYYQMDIYPTILHLIGCENYYWKGFGVNLLDSTGRNNRPISIPEAFVLSDKIIRANWFNSLVK